MASEVRTSFDLGDIAGIEIQCRECSAAVLYPLDKISERIMNQCPNCGTPMLGGMPGIGSVSVEQIKLAMRSLHLLLKEDGNLKANIRIQVKPILVKREKPDLSHA
jgi:DNA-directed RNA polymerase subunit RPC12/RpoP